MAQQSRVVPAVNTAIVAVIAVVLGAVALVVAPPSPPGIAEFAPEAVAAIKKAPNNQTSQFGQGNTGQCQAGTVCATPKPTVSPTASAKPGATAGPSADASPTPAPVTGVPSQLACVTWPDGAVTQTLDPQSPPCIATFDNSHGNGGATSQGVTATTIKVAVPNFDPTYQPDKDIVTFINTHYELYGRQLQIVPVTYSSYAADDPNDNAATGDEVAQAKPFAATGITGNDGEEQPIYRSKVVGAKVVYVGSGAGTITTKELAGYAPYAWTYQESGDETLRNLGEFTCASVAGHNATWSTQTRNKKRVFALLRADVSGTAEADTTPLTDALSSCGASPAKTIDFPYDVNSNSPDTQLQIQLRQLQQQGVTTLIVVGNRGGVYHAFSAASAVNFMPEWLVPGLSGQYFDYYTGQNATQAASLVGLATDGKKIAYTSQPWYEAVTAADPSYTFPVGMGVGGPDLLYKSLTLIAAGIQTAGPHLTPQSFSNGLTSTDFPDPGAGAAPAYQSTVGFLPGGHTFTRDLGVWWWSATQTNTEAGGATATQPGGFCWVGRGLRWKEGAWARNIEPYVGTCR